MTKICAIIMPAYKAEKFIMQAIESLRKQRLPKDWQIKFYIGVDACLDTATKLNNNNISYFYTFENVGCHVLVNTLMQKALIDGCEMLVKFDSDNYALDDFLYIGITNACINGIVTPIKVNCDEHLVPFAEDTIKSHSGTIFFTPRCINDVGGYAHYRVSSDKYLLLRANKLGYKDKHKGPRAKILNRRTTDSLVSSPLTGLDSAFRKTIIEKLQASLSEGTLKVEPVTTKVGYCLNNYSEPGRN